MSYLLKCPACQQEGLDPRYSPSPLFTLWEAIQNGGILPGLQF